MKKISIILLTTANLLTTRIHAQATWDTTRYVKYSDRFILSSFVSTRRFNCAIDQTRTEADSGKAQLDYNAEANTVTGFQINYDKISLSLGWNSGSPDVRTKGKTEYRDLALAIGENKWIIDGSLRSYKGFYDGNSAKYINDFKENDPFIQAPGMEIRQMRARYRYFTNHENFAYSAGYGYTCRQLKSAYSWVLGGGMVNNRVSTDTGFFHPALRNWYESDSILKQVEMTGVFFGGGLSANLVVFKRLFMNFTFNLYIEPQWRKYKNLDNTQFSKYKTSVSTDSRISFGYNGKRFFYFINGMVDFNKMNYEKLTLATRFISGSANIGYRFKAKCPRFYSKFKETWIYKKM